MAVESSYRATGGRDRGEGGWPDGVRAAVPVAVGYLPAAVAFGLVARQAGLSTPETVLSSALVFAGASQFALAGLVQAGTPPLVAAAAALFLNLRHLLYGPPLSRHLARLGPGRTALAAFGLTDEVFAVAFRAFSRGEAAGFGWLIGLEAGAYLSWVLGSWLGAAAGEAVAAAIPAFGPALGFALPALFLALLLPLVSPKGGPAAGLRATAAAVAVAVAVALHLAGLGHWSILAAGVAGPVAGGLVRRWREGERGRPA